MAVSGFIEYPRHVTVEINKHTTLIRNSAALTGIPTLDWGGTNQVTVAPLALRPLGPRAPTTRLEVQVGNFVYRYLKTPSANGRRGKRRGTKQDGVCIEGCGGRKTAGPSSGLVWTTPPQRCCARPLERPPCTSARTADHGKLSHDHADLLLFALLSRRLCLIVQVIRGRHLRLRESTKL